MPSLGDTVAALARTRRTTASPTPSSTGRLRAAHGFGTNPGALQMLLYAPQSLPRRAPLVVVLHGCGQTAEGYAEGAGWLALADRFGFAVLCPEQTRANNANLCFNWFEPGDTMRGKGEAASIRQMIARAVADHDLDPARVFVTGLSAGGAMAAALLAAYPEMFAAGAVIAGLPYGAASNMQEAFAAMFQGRSRSARAWGDLVRGASSHPGPWPRLSIWHGDADATVKPGAAEELAKQWADVHGLAGAGQELATADGRRRREWKSGGQTVVELHQVAGMAHGTPLAASGPDGAGQAGPFLLEVGISSSLEIARFWGIAGKRVERAQSVAPSRAERATSETLKFERVKPGAARPTTEPPKPDVAAVIAKALRTAGLLK